MNKDRGTIKWTSLMLPEHIQRLRAWENKLHHMPPKEKADWELEELHKTIQQAYQLKMPITFTLYKQDTWQTITGIITAIDLNKQHLLLETDTIVKAISFTAIQAAECDD
ncbi:YolD-like family protein [Lysinibacillus antri]|uniref:YolD-like family protein n=1 Tax=Lysinibacillus antri TaxID=2498145 RepID=A0A3S0P471_9BACI|nr:YolD-like family protein [Lysinibacillus antri]RUL48806.1 YolD-like family protein [Lysinibacillus antri]